MSQPSSYAQKYNAKKYKLWVARGLCRKCGKRKPVKDRVSCKPCITKARGWYVHNKPTVAAYQKRYLQKLKDSVFAAYGGYNCACCGEKRKEFLTIDHVDGGGSRHRREIGRGTNVLYLWLRRRNHPKGFRVLCMNCNFSYGMYGYCPHTRKHNAKIRC